MSLKDSIISGSGDKSIKIWDAVTESLINTLYGHTDRVSSVCYNPDNEQIISGSFDGSIRIWDADTGDLVNTLNGNSNIWCICYYAT